MKKTSIITTLFGAGGLVATLLAPICATFDDDVTTVANWQPVIGMVFANVGLFFARDHNVTSEQAGAK